MEGPAEGVICATGAPGVEAAGAGVEASGTGWSVVVVVAAGVESRVVPEEPPRPLPLPRPLVEGALGGILDPLCSYAGVKRLLIMNDLQRPDGLGGDSRTVVEKV